MSQHSFQIPSSQNHASFKLVKACGMLNFFQGLPAVIFKLIFRNKAYLSLGTLIVLSRNSVMAVVWLLLSSSLIIPMLVSFTLAHGSVVPAIVI